MAGRRCDQTHDESRIRRTRPLKQRPTVDHGYRRIVGSCAAMAVVLNSMRVSPKSVHVTEARVIVRSSPRPSEWSG